MIAIIGTGDWPCWLAEACEILVFLHGLSTMCLLIYTAYCRPISCNPGRLTMNICRGSEILREVAWVIFDEVHYMQDRERGVVWEEAIIFLPKGIRMVFLSATLSNASEFAGWVCHLHKQPCHVVYTDFRPTPLQHYAFPSGGSGLYLVSTQHSRDIPLRPFRPI